MVDKMAENVDNCLPYKILFDQQSKMQRHCVKNHPCMASTAGNSDAATNVWRSFMKKSVQIPAKKLTFYANCAQQVWQDESKHQPHLQKFRNNTSGWHIRPVLENLLLDIITVL